MKKFLHLLGLTLLLLAVVSCRHEPSRLYLLVGSYSEASEKGIHILDFDEESAECTLISETGDICNPSYLMPTAEGNRVYVVSETEDESAALFAYAFDKHNGTLKRIDSKPTNGTAPCYVWVNASAQLAVTANYNGGSLSIFPLNADGSMQEAEVEVYEGGTPDSERQSQPHLHCVYVSPDGHYLYANDLGTDHIYKYVIDEREGETRLIKGTPAYFSQPQGDGPRHAVFHPNSQYLYVIGELSGDVTTFRYRAANGDLQPIQTIEADSLSAAGSADIHLTPDGRFLYASNRLKGDGIAIFSVDPTNGLLQKVGYQPTGSHPRNFIITPNGKYLLCACRYENKIQIFQIDPQDGSLKDSEKSIAFSQPVCLKFIRK